MSEEYLIYLRLLLDNFLFASLLPIHKPWLSLVMKDFAFYNYNLMLLCSISGASLGGLLNYVIGLIFSLKRKNKVKFNKYLHLIINILIILFSWINIIGSIPSLLAGYIGIKLWYVIPGIVISYFFLFFNSQCMNLIKY